jgi:hypothetical protein
MPGYLQPGRPAFSVVGAAAKAAWLARFRDADGEPWRKLRWGGGASRVFRKKECQGGHPSL